MSQHTGSLDEIAGLPYLYLTAIGRKTGLPREIEIWFVVHDGSFYVFAERFHRAQWVRNIARNPCVTVRVGTRRLDANAAALDPTRDAAEWGTVQDLARAKYGWGDGLPVRITPCRALGVRQITDAL
jgi:deazaflavin-dependent oxidoreductase (nitroreductase family)